MLCDPKQKIAEIIKEIASRIKIDESKQSIYLKYTDGEKTGFLSKDRNLSTYNIKSGQQIKIYVFDK